MVLDDVGQDLLAAAAGHTPTLDDLSAVGLTFRTFYGAHACSPQRAQVLSGVYGFRPRNLIGRILRLSDGDVWSLPTQKTLPQRLNTSTAVVGKWHLAMPSDLMHPNACGFDESWVTFFNIPDDGSYYGGDLVHNGVTDQWTGYITALTASRAVDAIEAGYGFVYVPFHAPHTPYEPPPDGLHTYGDLSQATDFELALAMLEAADTTLRWIADAALARNYLVFVCADNGTAEQLGGQKGTLAEASVHTWLVAAGPGVRSGATDELVQSTDLYATVTELVNGAPAQTVDGIPFTPLLYEDVPGHRDFLYAERFSTNGQVPGPHPRTIRDQRWKLYSQKNGVVELYDLVTDPDERLDLNDGDMTQEEQEALDRLTTWIDAL